MNWHVTPEPLDAKDRTVLLLAAERVLAEKGASEWWRSGLEDLSHDAAPEEAWRGAGLAEP